MDLNLTALSSKSRQIQPCIRFRDSRCRSAAAEFDVKKATLQLVQLTLYSIEDIFI